MRLIAIDRVQPEQRLAKTLYDDNGHVLLAQGSLLRADYIERIKKLGIPALYIVDEKLEITTIEDVVTDGVRIQMKKAVKEALQKIKAGHAFDLRNLQAAINQAMDEVTRNRNTLIQITDIRSKNDPYLNHSVAVCILALLVGIGMDYNELKLKELGLGALLHDAGKALLPDDILLGPKSQTLSGRHALQNHTDLGFEVLRKTENISSIVAHVAWQHHECFDGTGYPRGLKGQDIHEYARIVAVADLYDELTSYSLQRERMLPHEALEVVRKRMERELDPDIVGVFVQRIAPYPVGSRVMLNTGAGGIVVEVSKEAPTQPVIKLLFDHEGRTIEEDVRIDLKEKPTVFVSNVER